MSSHFFRANEAGREAAESLRKLETLSSELESKTAQLAAATQDLEVSLLSLMVGGGYLRSGSFSLDLALDGCFGNASSIVRARGRQLRVVNYQVSYTGIKQKQIPDIFGGTARSGIDPDSGEFCRFPSLVCCGR